MQIVVEILYKFFISPHDALIVRNILSLNLLFFYTTIVVGTILVVIVS
jgi:hypothetical protein